MTFEEKAGALVSRLMTEHAGSREEIQILAGAVGLLQAEFAAEAMIKTEKNFDVIYKPMLQSIRSRATGIYEKAKREASKH